MDLHWRVSNKCWLDAKGRWLVPALKPKRPWELLPKRLHETTLDVDPFSQGSIVDQSSLGLTTLINKDAKLVKLHLDEVKCAFVLLLMQTYVCKLSCLIFAYLKTKVECFFSCSFYRWYLLCRISEEYVYRTNIPRQVKQLVKVNFVSSNDKRPDFFFVDFVTTLNLGKFRNLHVQVQCPRYVAETGGNCECWSSI